MSDNRGYRWTISAWNPLPTFVSIELDQPPQGTNDKEIVYCPAVRTQPAVVPIDAHNLSVVLSLRELYLHLDLLNLEVKNRSQAGDVQRAATIQRVIEIESARNTKADAAVSTAPKAGVETSRQSKSKSLFASETMTRLQPTSRTEWRLTDPASSELNGRYTGDDALCILNIQDKAHEATLSIEFFPKDVNLAEIYDDMIFQAIGAMLPAKKMRIITILVAKGLMEKVSRDRQNLTLTTKICAARCTLSAEDAPE